MSPKTKAKMAVSARRAWTRRKARAKEEALRDCARKMAVISADSLADLSLDEQGLRLGAFRESIEVLKQRGGEEK